VALAHYARTRAIADAFTYRLNLDTDQNTYWLTAQTGGAFATLPSEFGRVFSLPEGTVAQWQTPGSASANGWIPFYPDGRTEATTVRLMGRQGDIFDIVCSSPAEQFRVVAAPTEASP
jgi:Tfp pilus assembly protein FimT